MLRIGHLVWALPNAGLENIVCDMASSQCKEYEVTIVVVNDRIDDKILDRIDPSVSTIFLNRTSRLNLNFVKLFELALKRFDVMHIHDINLKTLRYFMPFTKNWYATIHNNRIVGNKVGLDAVSYVSNSIKEEWVSRDISLLLERVIYNGISVAELEPYFIEPKKRPQNRLVQIGRINFDQKGQDIALDVMDELPDSYSLTFVGDGPDRDRLEDLISEKNLENRVRVFDNVSRLELFEFLKNFEVCLMPSRFEGFGLVAAEAVLLGLPVIASDVDGLREVSMLVGGIHLIRPDCLISLKEAILNLKLRELNSGKISQAIELEHCIKSHNEIYRILCE